MRGNNKEPRPYCRVFVVFTTLWFYLIADAPVVSPMNPEYIDGEHSRCALACHPWLIHRAYMEELRLGNIFPVCVDLLFLITAGSALRELWRRQSGNH